MGPGFLAKSVEREDTFVDINDLKALLLALGQQFEHLSEQITVVWGPKVDFFLDFCNIFELYTLLFVGPPNGRRGHLDLSKPPMKHLSALLD